MKLFHAAPEFQHARQAAKFGMPTWNFWWEPARWITVNVYGGLHELRVSVIGPSGYSNNLFLRWRLDSGASMQDSGRRQTVSAEVSVWRHPE